MYSELDIHTESVIDTLASALLPSMEVVFVHLDRRRKGEHPTTVIRFTSNEDGRVFETFIRTREIESYELTEAQQRLQRGDDVSESPTEERRGGTGTPPEHGWPVRGDLRDQEHHDPDQPV